MDRIYQNTSHNRERAGAVHYCSTLVAAISSNSHQNLRRSSPGCAQEGCESRDRPGLAQGLPEKEAGAGREEGR